MIVRRLDLRNFRNYSDLKWIPHPFLNILSGYNAQGKTNLLEAIFFCTAGRSFRTSRDKEMVGWPGDECHAGAQLESKNSSCEISVSVSSSGKSSFFHNGRKESRSRLFRPAMSVAFTPADLELVKGSPSERRKWMDLELGPFDVQYLYNLEKFEKVLLQRNNLLKGGGRRLQLNELIEPWNEQLFLYGGSIIKARIRLLKKIFPHLREVFGVLTSGKEELSFNYLSSLPMEKGMVPEDLAGLYRETVLKNMAREVERQQTLFGPHRDDILFFINGADARRFGSRGQQRSVALALKIGLMKLYFQEFGEYPALLLDDVFLELDSRRQKGLESILNGEAQVFISSDRRMEGYFQERAVTYNVSAGKIFGGNKNVFTSGQR